MDCALELNQHCLGPSNSSQSVCNNVDAVMEIVNSILLVERQRKLQSNAVTLEGLKGLKFKSRILSRNRKVKWEIACMTIRSQSPEPNNQTATTTKAQRDISLTPAFFCQPRGGDNLSVHSGKRQILSEKDRQELLVDLVGLDRGLWSGFEFSGFNSRVLSSLGGQQKWNQEGHCRGLMWMDTYEGRR